MIIKVPEDYAVSRMSQNVQEAFQFLGEELIYLRMRHVGIDPGDRCSRCWDADYEQISDEFCPNCYGTTFDIPIVSWGRAWGLFTDNQSRNEQIRKWGIWETDDREVQVEQMVDAREHDYIIRVNEWSPDHKPINIQGRYRVDNTLTNSLRTGSRIGGQLMDRIGITCRAHALAYGHPMSAFPLDSTKPVPRFGVDPAYA
jgi:hypothetical protein